MFMLILKKIIVIYLSIQKSKVTTKSCDKNNKVIFIDIKKW